MHYNDIGKTFVLSLNNSERMVETATLLKEQGIQFDICEAVQLDNGAEGLKKTFRILFSYLLSAGFQNVLIMEDDVKFNYPYAKILMNNAMMELPNDFHILKFGCNLLCPPEVYSPNLFRLKMSYALHCALYSIKGMRMVMNLVDEDFKEPLDVLIAKSIMPLGKCFCSREMIATQRPSKSSIFEWDGKNNSVIDKIYNQETQIIDWDILMKEQWQKNTKNLNV